MPAICSLINTLSLEGDRVRELSITPVNDPDVFLRGGMNKSGMKEDFNGMLVLLCVC